MKQNLEDLTELVEIAEEDAFILHPGEFVLASTLEVVSLKPSREYTGNSLLCEDVLVDSGVTDLSVYDCIPGSQLGEDFWVEGVNPPGYTGP